MFQEGTNAVTFNTAFYLQQNPDVRLAIQNGTFQGNALQHFIDFGAEEGRNPNQFFDADYYLAQNPDVLVALGTPGSGIESAFDHFVRFGQFEGEVRAPSQALANFNAETYLAQNPDLQAAFANVPAADLDETLFNHFLNFGINENRPGTGVDTDGGAGNVINLTTAIENVVGTNSDDTFNGVISGVAGEGTFQTGDRIDGGGGNDTLSLIVSSAATITPASVTNVETISVQNLDGATINLANATGLKTLETRNSTDATNFVNVTAPVAISAVNGTGAIGVQYAANLNTGTADAQSVSVENFSSLVGASGIETFNVTASGENVVGLASSSDITTVNTAGAGDITYTNTFSTVTTFDASKATGDVAAEFTGADVKATGGSGDDVFDFGGSLTKTDVVNGGAGFDTVRVTNEGDLQTADEAARFNALTSIERVAFDGDGVILNGATFTNAGITNIEFNTTGADTINNAGSARVYEFGVDNTGAATFNMNAASTTLNLTLLGTEGGAAPNDGTDADVGAITVNLGATQPATAVATINLVSNGDLADTTFNNVGEVTAVAGSTLNISGAGNVDVASLGNAMIVNASTLTGDLVIQGSSFTQFVLDTDPVVDGNQTQAFESGADTITLGGGDNTVQFASGLDSGVVNTTNATTTAQGLLVDTIIGFTAGANGDVLDFTGTVGDADYTAIAAGTQTAINALSGAGATLLAAADLAAASFTTADEWTAFSFQGETYAFYNATDSATFSQTDDVLVRLTGVTVADLGDANFA